MLHYIVIRRPGTGKGVVCSLQGSVFLTCRLGYRTRHRRRILITHLFQYAGNHVDEEVFYEVDAEFFGGIRLKTE